MKKRSTGQMVDIKAGALSPFGRVRYFAVLESAPIQIFPDNFAFHGSRREPSPTLGNAFRYNRQQGSFPPSDGI
jgi:hypothetical protein